MADDTPGVVVYQVPGKVKDPYSSIYYGDALAAMVTGSVNENATVVTLPTEWHVQHLGLGLYRVVHSRNNVSYSLNLGAGAEGTAANMVQMGANFFDVQTVDGDVNPVDAGFTFAASFLG